MQGQQPGLKLCPSCNAYQDAGKPKCPNCGHDLTMVNRYSQRRKNLFRKGWFRDNSTKKKQFWGLYIISFFDFLAGGIMSINLILPVAETFDNYFGKGTPILIILVFYSIFGGIVFGCFRAGWKTLRFKPDIRLANVLISILILFFAFAISTYVEIKEIETIRGIDPSWIIRFIYFYVLWSFCYLLRPKLKAKLITHNQLAEAAER